MQGCVEPISQRLGIIRVKMDLKVVGCDPRDWIALAEDRDQ